MRRSSFIFVSGIWILVSQISSAIVDSNNNGLSDLWEKHFNSGNLLTDPDPQADPDGDGWTHAQEAAAGTNPFDPNPPGGYIQPYFLHSPETWADSDGDDILEHTPEAVVLTWETIPGKQYTLQSSPDLTGENWFPIEELFLGNGNVMGAGFPVNESENPRPDKFFWRVAVTDSGLDFDSDGLSNYEEYLAGTDPVITDSDGDTLSDYAELIAGTNPNHADEDGDGITDPLEIAAGTDSKNQDTDGDAIPDYLDTQPLLSAQIFTDADDDGIPDANDPDPNNPRGPKPLIISENASGNPNCELEMDESSSFILTVSNPAGPAPTPSDFKLYLNGTEETANITALTTPPSAIGTQRFNFSWLAKVTTSYPAQTLQNISLRFKDAQNATTWLNLARVDVAEWEGMIAALPYGPPSEYWRIRADSHHNGVKITSARNLGASNAGSSVWYRGPKNVSLLDFATGSPRLTAQIPEGCRYPLFFISGMAPTALAVTQTLDVSNPDTYNHHGVFYINNHSTDIRMTLDPGGTMTIPPGQLRYQPMAEVSETGPPLTHVQGFYPKDGQEKVLTITNWPLYPAAGILRAYSAVNFFTTTTAAGDQFLTYAGADLWAEMWAGIIPHTAGSLEQPGIAISPAGIRNVSYDGSRLRLLPIQSGQWHKLVLKVGPDAGALSNGIHLKLGAGEDGEGTPQTGFELQVQNGNGLSALTIPTDGKIEMSPTSELYQKLVSPDGLTLFLKRNSTVTEFHQLGLDLIPKRSTYTVQRVAALDLPPVDFVDKDGVILTELKIGKMYPSVLTGSGLSNGPVSVALDNDLDRFFVRVKGNASLSSVKMKFETVDNPNAKYNDDPTEYTLTSTDGYFKTESMVLVSDDVDDHHLKDYPTSTADDSPDDRTHKIQLGGNFKISEIKIGTGNWMAMDVKLPVRKKKTVKVQFVNCTYGIFDLDPCWTNPQIERAQKHMQERYAQVGIEFDFQPTVAGANVDLDGEMTDSEVPSFDGSVGKIYFPQETKDLIDHGPPNDLHNTLMIYLVKKLGEYGGIATPPKYVESFNVRFHNKVLLANAGLRDFTAGHEALHVLTDAAHAPPTYGDFNTERGHEHTLWSQPLVTPFYSEMDRADNISVGSTKRISIAQETAAQSSPLAK